MNRGSIFRRTVSALFVVSIMVFAAMVCAEVKLYTATAEDYANEVESQDIAKLRARDKAIKKATKQAGVYLQTHSHSVNGELTDDDIIAITSNSWQLVGEPKYTRTLKQISDETTIIVWTATVEVNVDDAEIQSWLKRDDKDRFNIITQTREAQKATEENERKIEDLRAKYNRATSQAEKDNIRKQMNEADRDFLANQKLEEGNKLAYAKDYYGAIKLYREALQLKPDWDWAYNNRGCAYDDLGQNERAIQDFNKTIEINPNDEYAYYNRGRVHSKIGQCERAIQDYNKAIELNPNWEYPYCNRGNVYLKLEQYERAIQDFDKSIKLKPNLVEAYNNRGETYRKLGKYEKAIKDFNKAIEINPNYADAYYNRGNAYVNLEQYERAIQDYNKAIQINPNDAGTYNIRGLIYQGLGQYEQAIQDYDKAIQINPNDANKYFNRCLAYALMGNFKRAITDLTKSIQLNQNHATAYQLRGMCYQSLGDDKKAQADFAKAKELGYKG